MPLLKHKKRPNPLRLVNSAVEMRLIKVSAYIGIEKTLPL
jgi:hypothetical protein